MNSYWKNSFGEWEREENSLIRSMSLQSVKRGCLAKWKGNLSPFSSPCGEPTALINPHARHVSSFVHSCMQQHLKPCHQGDSVWVHWQMCSFSGTETKASSGSWHGAHASTTSQKTSPFDLSPASDFRIERRDERKMLSPHLQPEKSNKQCGLMLIHIWIF